MGVERWIHRCRHRGGLIAEARHSRKRPYKSLLPSIVLDVTLIGIGMKVVQLQPVGVGIAFIYMLVMPALLLP